MGSPLVAGAVQVATICVDELVVAVTPVGGVGRAYVTADTIPDSSE